MLGRDLENLKAGILRIECPSMTLSNQDREAPVDFSGPGEIHFDSDGQLEVVLYDQEHEVALPGDSPSGPSGILHGSNSTWNEFHSIF